jgi:retron-type reverse transcriptase
MSDLYSELKSFENLYSSFIKARDGKRSKENVAKFEKNLEVELFKLQDELEQQTYRPGKYHSFYRTEAKRRLISAAPFRDRVVHHALINILEPIYEKKFIHDTYANRKGKGTHRALDRCTKFLRSFRYVLQCDVRQFFPSIDHAILIRELQGSIRNEDILHLCSQIIETGVGVLDEEYEMRWFPADDLWAANRPRGLPIGNLTSQFWANVYLNPLDHFVKRSLHCKGYLRYVDDFLLFADDKQTLFEWKRAVVDFLAGLRLTLHENKAQVRPVSEGFPFLGFVIFPDHRRLIRARGISFRRRLWEKVRQYHAGEIERQKVDASVQSWISHTAHGDTWGLRRAVLGEIRL